MSALGEAAFAALHKDLQSRIDDAFNTIFRKRDLQAAARSQIPFAAGGFIVEDSPVDIDEKEIDTKDAHIPLSSIPAALELLDLPPDDEQILSVFRDAATDEDSDDNMTISRHHWRAVCAVLLENSGPEDDEMETSEKEDIVRPRRAKAAYKKRVQEDMTEDDDKYIDSGSSSESYDNDGEDSDDEYTAVQATPTPRRQTRNASQKRTTVAHESKGSTTNKGLSSAQSQACMDSFALFFPLIESGSDELRQQRIMLKDLQQAMTLAGEKAKADELIEMLEMFSTSPDKSIGFQDFQKIMIAAKLI